MFIHLNDTNKFYDKSVLGTILYRNGNALIPIKKDKDNFQFFYFNVSTYAVKKFPFTLGHLENTLAHL